MYNRNSQKSITIENSIAFISVDRRDLCQMALTNQDGSQFLMANDESIALDSDDPVLSYFEFEVIKEGKMAIELRSENTGVTMVYDGELGDALETNSNQVISGKPLKKNNVVGVSVWSSRRVENGIVSLCEVTIDGKVCVSRAVRINGADIIPSIYMDSAAKVRPYINDKSILVDKGKCVLHLINNMKRIEILIFSSFIP